MCGITGLLSKEKNALIIEGTHAIKHRGPEAQNFWYNTNGTVVFGHNRLCIIDRSETASQPMQYSDRYTIIHNGEIYNYLEIKKQLQAKGYSFKSASDTEVIVAAYAAYGEQCLLHFDGAFAFAIWDEQGKKLFAARDRFGEKPFYFFYNEKQLAFASEMKALWAMHIPKEVNEALLYNFLTIGYTSNPADPSETFYKSIRQLPPSSYLVFDQEKNELKIDKYWQPYIEVHASIKDEEAIEQFRFLLSDSIRKRLRSDVPIGTSLSGGLDSSTIVALCSQISSQQYSHKAFTAVFEGFEKNEEQHAKIVANQFGLQHYRVTINENEIVDLMSEAVHYQEMPVASASALAQYKVYQTAKLNGVTVLLDGQGADEILGGYHKYYKWYWQELYRQKRLSGSDELTAARDLGITESFTYKHKMAALFPEFAASILQTRKAKQAFNHPSLNRDFAFSNKQKFYYATPSSFDLNGALYYNTFVYGLNELLHLADRNSMAHATEVRLPFLNHQLVEFLFTLPPHLKIKNGWTKWILRKTAEPLLPKEIVWRKDKVGFEPPQKRWMQNSHVLGAIQEAKKLLVAKDILHASTLSKKIQPHDAHAADNLDWKLWSASYLFRQPILS
jgi:asparagine synthase (glutamine-hydrolysing)